MTGDAVAVTGSDGFVGRHLVAGLLEAGCRVHAFTRKPLPSLQQHSNLRCHLIRGLDDDAALRRGLEGVSALVHLAARVHGPVMRGEDPLLRRVNVDGTRNVVERALEQGARHVVFLSTIAVLGDTTHADDAAPAAPVTAYGRTKLEAEMAVTALTEQGDCKRIILRPPGVYGPGMRGSPLQLYKLIASGLPVPVPREPVRRSLIFVGNLVAAVLRALRLELSGCFVLADQEVLLVEELVRGIAASLGRPARLVELPVRWLRLVGELGELFRFTGVVPVNRRAAELFTIPLQIDASRFWNLTGEHPPWTAMQGLQRTGEWFSGARSAG